MPARLKLTLAYDGASFAGWQSQKHGNTIQDRLERAIEQIIRKRLRVHGAGRTDAGVHALGQCAHVDLPNRARAPNEWRRALNALLPPSIRVLRARYVSATFHARFSAKAKTYRYRIWAAPVLPPFEAGRAWHITKPLDFKEISSAVGLFAGTHNFAGFAANRGKAAESSVRTIHRAQAKKSGALITLEFTGDGFLYKMVRMMVSAAVDCATGKVSPRDVAKRLAGASLSNASRSVAPAEGLILVRVGY
jgi:tRNA pseudouridine38-40 synthase